MKKPIEPGLRAWTARASVGDTSTPRGDASSRAIAIATRQECPR